MELVLVPVWGSKKLLINPRMLLICDLWPYSLRTVPPTSMLKSYKMLQWPFEWLRESSHNKLKSYNLDDWFVIHVVFFVAVFGIFIKFRFVWHWCSSKRPFAMLTYRLSLSPLMLCIIRYFTIHTVHIDSIRHITPCTGSTGSYLAS